MIDLTPTEVLSYSALNPEHFGVSAGTTLVGGEPVNVVDTEGNVVYSTVEAARLAFDDIVVDQSDAVRAKLALIYYALAKLYGVLADRKGMYVGLVTQRGGQVSTPLGSYAELMNAASRNYQEARNLYPDAAWPSLDPSASGGTVALHRTYVP